MLYLLWSSTLATKLNCQHIHYHIYNIQAAGQFGRLSVRAALVVGNAVKTKIQQQHGDMKSSGDDTTLDGEDQLNELLQSQIATDETEVDIHAAMNDTSALNEDPTTLSSPGR